MANTFKQATKSSLVTSSVTASGANILTAGASSTLILLSALVSNKTSTSANVSVYLTTNTGDDVYLLSSVPVPAGSSLELISGSKIILEASDILRANSDTSTALDLTISYLEQT